MKKPILFVALLITTSFLGAPVVAGTITGKVADILFTDGPAGSTTEALTYVFVDGTPSGKPACATASYWMVRDAKSEGGKLQIAALMTAKASGRDVTIAGTNACARSPDGEDIKTVVLK